jgi:imidazolonepropionase-like amidohydrolase
MMTIIKKCCFPVGLFISSLIFAPRSTAQVKQIYQVYKLENKIGTEEVTASAVTENTSVQIAIRTQDRGYNLSLIADLKTNNSGFKYTSAGHTSRFKKENIDTLISATGGFPLSENGSIKIRELLINQWMNAEKPGLLKSAFGSSGISIKEMTIPSTAAAELRDLRAFLINQGLYEVYWMDKNGKSVFLTTNDSEGDKREIVNDKYVRDFTQLNQQSTQFMLQAYSDKAQKLGEKYATIAIVAGNIVDLTRSGEVQKNMMILIKKGKIDYVGTTDRSLIPSDAKVIDATNKFLIPGLWDMHAHVFHPSYLQKELLSGVTSLRDMANEFDFVVQLKNLASKGTLPVPTIYAAGLLDGKSLSSLGAMLATNPEEIKTNVKRYHDAGFNQIKIYDNIKKKDFNSIVTEARRYHMDVVGHLPTGYTMGYFINNGMNSISHIHFFMNSIKWSSADLTAANRPLLDSLKSHRVYLDPTINVYQMTGDKRTPLFGRLLNLFSNYGIPIVAGTDNEGTIPDEIQTYVQLGMSPLNALRAATVVPAEIMGATQQSGSLEKGKNGDLLILDENPLTNISTLKKITTVIKGQYVVRP